MSDFVKEMLGRMERGELQVRRSTPSSETKWTYHFGATDPKTGRTVIGVGGGGCGGDDFSWGKEIPSSDVESYLATDDELAARAALSEVEG